MRYPGASSFEKHLLGRARDGGTARRRFASLVARPALFRLYLAMVALVGSVPARAQAVDPETRTAARELARQGADAFERKDYLAAVDLLNRAYSLFPAPSISVLQARALVRLGRLVEALDRYEEARIVQLPDDAPEALRQAVMDARREGEELRARIPRLAICLGAGRDLPPGLVVRLNGKVVPPALLGVERPVDPTVHQITAEAPGYQLLRKSIRLKEGDVVRLELVLEPQPSVPRHPTLQPSLPVSRRAPEPEREVRPRVWGWAAVGVGAVGLSVSAITGMVALGRKSYLDSVCEPGCPPSAADDIDTFRKNRTISYLALAVGAASLGAGGYLLLVGPRDSAHLAANLGQLGVRATW